MNKSIVTAFLLSSVCAVGKAQTEPPRPSPNEIIVTASGIHMGRDIGKSDAAYSQLLKAFVVRNNIQGDETFRKFPCTGALHELPTDIKSRKTWIKNIEMNFSGKVYTTTGEIVDQPVTDLKFSIDARYGPVTTRYDEVVKQVRHAVATRMFDSLMLLSAYLNSTTKEICPKAVTPSP